MSEYSVHPIQFHCPECGAHLGATKQVAGKKVECPHCRVPIEVPTESETPASAE